MDSEKPEGPPPEMIGAVNEMNMATRIKNPRPQSEVLRDLRELATATRDHEAAVAELGASYKQIGARLTAAWNRQDQMNERRDALMRELLASEAL